MSYKLKVTVDVVDGSVEIDPALEFAVGIGDYVTLDQANAMQKMLTGQINNFYNKKYVRPAGRSK